MDQRRTKDGPNKGPNTENGGPRDGPNKGPNTEMYGPKMDQAESKDGPKTDQTRPKPKYEQKRY